MFPAFQGQFLRLKREVMMTKPSKTLLGPRWLWKPRFESHESHPQKIFNACLILTQVEEAGEQSFFEEVGSRKSCT